MKQKIIIIGAGVSGLYAASLLEDTYDVTILEARSRIGGRIYSAGGHDLGPSWIWSHHKEVLALTQHLGLRLFAQYTQGDALYDAPLKPQRFVAHPSAPSARVQGSLSVLIDALKSSLSATSVELEEEAVAIQKRANDYHVKTKKRTFEAHYVIVTLPPRLSARLAYEPPLPEPLLLLLRSTPTWMGQSGKCVIEFRSAFWKQRGLSGFVFSNTGPLSEIHDACTQDTPALFGFVHSKASWQTLHSDITKQLIRLFGIQEQEIVKIQAIDWKSERFTSDALDAVPLNAHPHYGIDTTLFSEKILFSATEFSFEEGGYIEGAIRRVKAIAAELLGHH